MPTDRAADPRKRPGLPPGTVLRADPSLEWAQGPVVTGGAPWRLFSLSEDGASTLRGLIAGAPVDRADAGELARRLSDAGLLHVVRAPRAAGRGEVEIVVPVRDDAEALDRLLTSLAACAPVVVVDDGSADPDRTAQVAHAHLARLVRREVTGGAAAARNAGLLATTAPLVAFFDSDVAADERVLERLLPHFDDDAVAAVAPRVMGPPGPGALARFEQACSPLDLGPREGFVRPGAAVPYVPAAALVVRRSALGAGFDERLRVGEDVDLIWRLVEEGWLVRYEPATIVYHRARGDLHAWLSQRFGYGRSAAALERRHGDAAAPFRADARVLVVVALAAAGRPRAALWVLAWTTRSMVAQLEGSGAAVDARLARRLALRGTVLSAPGIARAAFRTYGPWLLAAAIPVGALRRPVAALALGATATRWWRAGRPAHRASFAALSVLDDLAYGAGVAVGAMGARRPGALVPRLGRATRRAAASRT